MLYWLFPKIASASDVFVPQVVKLMAAISKNIIDPFVKVLFAIALLVFAVGMIEFFLAKQSGEALEQGRRHMIWGIVGMAVMAGVFGIMYFIITTLGITYIK